MVSTTHVQALRQKIEAELAGSFAGALTPRMTRQRPLLPFGIDALDEVAGGVPMGAVTELTGVGSTGKTGVAMQVAAGAMRSGKVCAWVDAGDCFDPATGEANGMVLPQLLWVRCGGQRPVEGTSGRTIAVAGAVPDQGGRVHGAVRGHCGSHPRAEERGLDQAVSHLFQAGVGVGAEGSRNTAAGITPSQIASARPLVQGETGGRPESRSRQAIGTPGAPNAPLSPLKRASFEPRPAFRPVKRSEQVATDRLGGRNLQAWTMPPREGSVEASQANGSLLPAVPRPLPMETPWGRLDQALRAADLLLQGGGFAVLVLDLGSIAPEHVLRIPAATWFRFRAVAEANGTAVVLLSQAPCARSSAALVIQFSAAGFVLAGGTVVESVRYRAEIARQRFAQVGRKGPMATWEASPYCRAEHLRPAATHPAEHKAHHGEAGVARPAYGPAPVLPWPGGRAGTCASEAR